MANRDDDHLTYYREFFENFAKTVNPNDQLPVKLGSYKLINLEVVGGVIDWTTQYLTQKKCPLHLIGPLVQIIIEETRKTCKKDPVACGFNPQENAYEPLKLMQSVMAKTNEICLRYLDNSMLCSLPPPGPPFNVVSACASRNRRNKMEDRHVVIHDLNTMFSVQDASPSSYYAIFDGHAGLDAAAYSSAHLHQFLAESKYFMSDPKRALRDAFAKTDSLFIKKCDVEGKFGSGTTAVCALHRPKEKKLYVAWVGDSQALLVSQGRILQCVDPHKPGRSDEKQRIEKEGGFVSFWGTWRVNGQLAVSRAIGDAMYKPYVSAVPDIREITLDGDEDFIILACDGLWDFLTEDSAAKAVYYMLFKNADSIDLVGERLVQYSKESGSADNISVIVVFLREPHKIAAEARWANRNGSPNTMDTSLDNANNPFANSNGAGTDNILNQKADGLLLNISERFKQNGGDLSPAEDFFHAREKSNGKRLASQFDDDEDDDDLGPETDVDTVDDLLSSSIATAKAMADGIVNNNPEGSFNPFVEKHEVEKAALEIEFDLQKQQSSEFDGERSPREETPTPPADAVHDVGGLEDNAADSGEDSDDEWNYIKGEEANKENISPVQPDDEVALILEETENMSQLNPNAAEFVPVSPTRSIPSPACRMLLNDPVIAQSPKRPSDIDISLPNPQEFENEVKSRPSDVDSCTNGHEEESEFKCSSQDLMDNLLNGKNIDEIPEFQPGITPTKVPSTSDEFHFGPNAAPFTPTKFLDQSEAALSTKAVYGDESCATLETSFEESAISQDNPDFTGLIKEQDPMSMSFYQDKTDSDIFDLNKVQVLPDNIDDFLSKPDQLLQQQQQQQQKNPFDDDLSTDVPLDNEERLIQTTDLDKIVDVDDEKELASPLSPDNDLLGDDFNSDAVVEDANSPIPIDSAISPVPVDQKSPLPVESAVSPVPVEIIESPALIEDATSPVPVRDLISPVPVESSKSPVPSPIPNEDPISSPISNDKLVSTSPIQQDIEVSVSPVPPPVESENTAGPKSPVPPTPSPEPQLYDEIVEFDTRPAQVVDFGEEIQAQPLLEPSAPPKPDPEEKTEIITFEQEEINVPLFEAALIPQELCELPSKSPELEKKEEVSIESPHEDITSSVKDVSSPIQSPIPDQISNDLVQEEACSAVLSNTAQEALKPLPEDLSPLRDDVLIPESCPISTPKSVVTEAESVATADVNSFLDRSQISDVASPLSPAFDQSPLQTTDDIERTLITDECLIPQHTTTQHVDIKTENITPEYAEPTVVLSGEVSKDEASSGPSPVEEPLKEPETEVKPVPAVEIAAGVVAAAAIASAAATIASTEKKTTIKAKTPSTSTGVGKKPPAKSTAPLKSTVSSTKPKTPTTVTKQAAAPPKPAAARTSIGSRTTATKPAPAKPRTTLTSTARTTVTGAEKKPLTNGDIKPIGRTPLSSVRKSTESTVAKTTSRTVSSTATAKTSPSKPAPLKSTTVPTKSPRPISATAPPKPRPTTLPSKAPASATSRTAVTTTKSTLLKTATSPTKPATPPARPATAPIAKPRVPLTKTVTKTPTDAEKQIKDSANKLTASRSATTTARTSTATGKTTSAVHKTETKITGNRTTVTKTTTTSRSSTTALGRKPAEIVRNIGKTKTTKVEKPIQNGVSTVVTEQITIVNNAVSDGEPQLVKDNSPVDNKLLVETTNAAD